MLNHLRFTFSIGSFTNVECGCIISRQQHQLEPMVWIRLHRRTKTISARVWKKKTKIKIRIQQSKAQQARFGIIINIYFYIIIQLLGYYGPDYCFWIHTLDSKCKCFYCGCQHKFHSQEKKKHKTNGKALCIRVSRAVAIVGASCARFWRVFRFHF